MRKCPKCSMEYEEDRKICRACGAALDDYAPPEPAEPFETSSATPTVEPEEEEPILAEFAEPITPRHSWKCATCGQLVPSDFAVCWSCGTDKAGLPDPEFAPATDEDIARLENELAKIDSKKTGILLCPKCGSKKIIPNARICDHHKSYEGDLELVVYGEPEALIFKDRLYGSLTADICGECGHLELRVGNHRELYEHYLYSKKSRERFT